MINLTRKNRIIIALILTVCVILGLAIVLSLYPKDKITPIYSGDSIVRITSIDWSYQKNRIVMLVLITMMSVLSIFFCFIPKIFKPKRNILINILFFILLRVLSPLVIITIYYFAFQGMINYPYKVEYSYDNINRSFLVKQSNFILRKENNFKITISENQWIEINYYSSDPLDDFPSRMGRCGLFSSKGQGPILFEGSPENALLICNYFIKMTDLCALHKSWVRRDMESCKVLNRGKNVNCSCD